MIRFIGISHQLGERQLFGGLSWHIKPGARVGLVGDNGAGKTTLLRMAAREFEPETGEVVARRHIRIGFLKQEIHAAAEGDGSTPLTEAMKAFDEEREAEEEVHRLYDGLATAPEAEHAAMLERIHALEGRLIHHEAAVAEGEARKVLAGLGFPGDIALRPLASFSGGWQMRAHIARLLLERPDVLMLDEPTNHLDLESLEWLEEFLATFAGALVVVSHDRWFLDRVTTSTAWLFRGRLRTYTGGYTRFVEQREMEEEQLVREYENQQKQVAHIQEFVERFRYKASKAAAVQSRVKMLEKIDRLELPQSVRRVRLRLPEPAPSGRRLVELRDAAKSYDGRKVLSGVTLFVERGDKIGLLGRNGAGKTTLLKMIGGIIGHDGYRLSDLRAQIEHFSQYRVDELDAEGTVLSEARPPGASATEEQLRALLGGFLFSGDDVLKPVGVLSGGEKSRLALARLTLRRGNLLLLDEPTNHLDMATRDILQRALAEFPGAIVMISHDRSFIDGVANKIIEVADGKIRIHHGNYSDYTRRKKQEAEAAAGGGAPETGRRAPADQAKSAKTDHGAAGALAAIALANRDRPDNRRETARERQERNRKRSALRNRIRVLEDRIAEMEERLAQIHTLQSDPQAWTDGRMTPEIGAEAKGLEADLAAVLNEWEALSEEHEGLE